MRRYLTYEPFTYGELERLAGIGNRFEFWRRFATESEARAEIHARIERRIAAGEFTPCWKRAIDPPKRCRKAA